jgi:hypothetical protein
MRVLEPSALILLVFSVAGLIAVLAAAVVTAGLLTGAWYHRLLLQRRGLRARGVIPVASVNLVIRTIVAALVTSAIRVPLIPSQVRKTLVTKAVVAVLMTPVVQVPLIPS